MQSATQATNTATLRNTVTHLLEEPRSLAPAERRDEQRQPFFRPVTIFVETQDDVRSNPGFTRDISPSGVGLLHNMPLEECEVIVAIPRQLEGPVHLRCQVNWCQPCGDGWYLSGCRFLKVAASG